MMKQKNRIVFYQGSKYITIASTRYFGNEYIFVINSDDINDVKILICLNELKELDDISLIYKIVNQMKV